MSVAPSTPIPAGWYPDPAGSFQQRWWNGSAWTNDFAQYRPTLIHSAPLAESLQSRAEQPAFATYAALQQAAQQQAAQAAATRSSAARTSTLTREARPAVSPPSESERPFGLPPEDQAPLTSVARPNAGNAVLVPVTPVTKPPVPEGPNADWANYLPFAADAVAPVRRGGRVHPSEFPEKRFTASSWILGLLPAAFLGLAVLVAMYVPTLYTTLTQAILGAALLLVGIGLAALDRHKLYLRGHLQTASPAWAILTPITYLGVRAVIVARETGKTAFAPLALLLVVVAAIVAAVVLVPGLSALLTANSLY